MSNTTDDILRANANPSFPFWSAPLSEIDVIVTCQHCLKKMGLERRFIEPIMPRTITCPYCEHAITISEIEEGK